MFQHTRSLLPQHTHLLTAEECILAADLQNKYPNPCKHSAAGYFGSKFTTLCISGNEKCEVEIRGYQVGVACSVWTNAGLRSQTSACRW